MAASLVLGGAVTSLAEEAGTAAGSQQIEYADLEQLIKGANPEVQAKRADLDHWVGEYEAARDEIMENRARLREDAREMKDDGDLEGSRHYLEQAKMLKESADQLDKQIRSLNSASNTMDIRQTEDTAILAAQDVMGTWHSLSLDRESAGAKLEAASYKKEKLERQLAEGMVTQADVDQAEKDRMAALGKAEALDGELEQMKRELCLLTGHTYDAAVEIGALPAANLERAGALDLEADKQTAWGNSYELRSQRHSGFSGTNKERHSRERSMDCLLYTSPLWQGRKGAGGRTCERHVPDAPAHQGEAVGQWSHFRHGQRGRGVQYPRGDHYHECEGGRQGHQGSDSGRTG